MNFKINNMDWKIEEKSKEELAKINGEKEIDGEYFGLCVFKKQTIYLNKDLPIQQKRKTLIHELTHCYIGSCITFTFINNTAEDVWCDIVANSHDVIHEIVEDYMIYLDSIKPKMPSLEEFKEQFDIVNKKTNIC